MITTYCDIWLYMPYAVKVAQWHKDCLFDAINSNWFAVIIPLDQLASGIHHPVTESTHWEFAWCPLEIFLRLPQYIIPTCAVFCLWTLWLPISHQFFFFRGKSLSRQFPFGSDRSGNKAEKLAPCDLLLFWTYSSLKIPLEICWKVDVFVCVSFNRCWSHQHSRGFFGDCPKAFGSWWLLVSLRIGCYQSSYVRSVRWQAFTVSLATLQTSHVMYSHWIVIVRPKR